MSLEVTSGPSLAARSPAVINDAIRRASAGEADAFELLFRCYARACERSPRSARTLTPTPLRTM